jgi:hypothetical protein
MTCVHPDIPHAIAAGSSSLGRRVAVSANTCRNVKQKESTYGDGDGDGDVDGNGDDVSDGVSDGVSHK